LRVISDTSAAAVAYAFNCEDYTVSAVLDIGSLGGGFCVFKGNKKGVHIVASTTEKLPAGDDFDSKLMHTLSQASYTEYTLS